VSSVYFAVYNRWGQRLFESTEQNQKWDGNFNNEPCEVGTYFYMLKYNCESFKEPKLLKGDVSLLR
jgi:gliding motility-associated-like protein